MAYTNNPYAFPYWQAPYIAPIQTQPEHAGLLNNGAYKPSGGGLLGGGQGPQPQSGLNSPMAQMALQSLLGNKSGGNSNPLGLLNAIGLGSGTGHGGMFGVGDYFGGSSITPSSAPNLLGTGANGMSSEAAAVGGDAGSSFMGGIGDWLSSLWG